MTEQCITVSDLVRRLELEIEELSERKEDCTNQLLSLSDAINSREELISLLMKEVRTFEI